LIGGNDGHVLKSVEQFDMQTHTWAKVKSMSTRRDELAAALGPDGKIYAVGGYGGKDK
jgi:hypothetical protein